MTFQFPNIPEREAELIGLILANPASIHEVTDRIPEHAFLNDLTRAVWREMVALAGAGTKVAIPMIRERVKLDPARFGIPDIAAFLATCLDRASGDVSLSDLAEIMIDQATLSELSKVMRETQEKIAKGQGTGDELAASARMSIDGLLNGMRPADSVSFSDAAHKFAASVSSSFKKGQPIGSDWGLRPVNGIAGMISDGDFIVLGGPSYHGKSILAHQIAMHMASRRPILQIQPEMRPEAIAGREILGRTGVDHSVIESGGMQPAEVEAILDAARRYEGLPYEICHTGDMRVSKIRSRIESFRHRYGDCGLVIIDTIKHVDPEDKNARSTVDKVIASAKRVYQMAKDLDVAIMVLAQVKEQYFERPNADFFVNDLYGGGDLRELADIVLLIHQPGQKLAGLSGRSGSERGDLEGIRAKWEGLAEAKCVKRRRGRPGSTKLKFEGSRMRFGEVDEDQEDLL